jgi:hypothetical protein
MERAAKEEREKMQAEEEQMMRVAAEKAKKAKEEREKMQAEEEQAMQATKSR